MTTQTLSPDTYVRNEAGDWKVTSTQDGEVKAWRITEQGSIEESTFPSASLTAITLEDSTWTDPADL